MQDCAAPTPKGRTNAALAEYLLGYKGALDACNADKAALRQWVQAAKK